MDETLEFDMNVDSDETYCPDYELLLENNSVMDVEKMSETINSSSKPEPSSESLTEVFNRPITRSATKGIPGVLVEFKDGFKSNRISKKKNQKTLVIHKDKPVDISEAMKLLTLTQENFLDKLKRQIEEKRLKLEKENQSTDLLFNLNKSSDKFVFTPNEKRFHTELLQDLSARYRKKLFYEESSDNE